MNEELDSEKEVDIEDGADVDTGLNEEAQNLETTSIT
jgi:hypothetical protein